jgi:hypothetical protein
MLKAQLEEANSTIISLLVKMIVKNYEADASATLKAQLAASEEIWG